MNDETSTPPGQSEHPRGTLAVVGVFGALFLVAWLIMYFIVFGSRGPLS